MTLFIADELHRFILGHIKTHLPAGNVGQAIGYRKGLSIHHLDPFGKSPSMSVIWDWYHSGRVMGRRRWRFDRIAGRR